MTKEAQISFEELHQQYHLMVTQMCLGFVKGDVEIANDLSQEIFINIWRKFSSFKGESALKTWVYRITVNTCLQYIRKEKNKKTIGISHIEYTLTDESIANKTEDYKSLYIAIGQLKELDRLLIMMVLEGQENDTIAEVIGVSAINTRVKIHRIKKRLKKILENE